MSRKPVSNPEDAALGKSQGNIGYNSNFRDQAFGHNLGRNVRVVEVLTHLAKMVVDGRQFPGHVECVAAERQNFSSPKTLTHMGMPAAPSQAAHFLPGQIRIGGQNIWEWALDSSTRRRLEFVFAQVEHLPVAFNQADSAAERKGEPCGLAAAFAAGCAAVIKQSDSPVEEPSRTADLTGTLPDPHSPAGRMLNWASMGIAHPDSPASRSSLAFLKNPGRHDRFSVLSLVAWGFEVWRSGAEEALRLAAAAKNDKPGLPPLEGNPFDGYTPESISRRSTADTRLWNRDDASRILQYYLEDQHQRTVPWARGVCGRSL